MAPILGIAVLLLLVFGPALWVRAVLGVDAFLSTSPLPSTLSAAETPALFESFSGTMGLSDFPRSSIIGLRPWPFRCGPHIHHLVGECGTSRFPCIELPRMQRVSDRAGSVGG